MSLIFGSDADFAFREIQSRKIVGDSGTECTALLDSEISVTKSGNVRIVACFLNRFAIAAWTTSARMYVWPCSRYFTVIVRGQGVELTSWMKHESKHQFLFWAAQLSAQKTKCSNWGMWLLIYAANTEATSSALRPAIDSFQRTLVWLPTQWRKCLVETDKPTCEESSLCLHHRDHKNLLHIDREHRGIAGPHPTCIIHIVIPSPCSICMMDGLDWALLAFCQGMWSNLFSVAFGLLAGVTEICPGIPKCDAFGSELLPITLIWDNPVLVLIIAPHCHYREGPIKVSSFWGMLVSIVWYLGMVGFNVFIDRVDKPPGEWPTFTSPIVHRGFNSWLHFLLHISRNHRITSKSQCAQKHSFAYNLTLVTLTRHGVGYRIFPPDTILP